MRQLLRFTPLIVAVACGTTKRSTLEPVRATLPPGAQALSFLGDGVTVAVLDSGTDFLENPDLDPALAGEECFCSRLGGCCPDGSTRQSGFGSARTLSGHGPGVIFAV